MNIAFKVTFTIFSRLIMLLLILAISCNFAFSETICKEVDTLQGKIKVYYDSFGKEVARENHDGLISGAIPDGDVREEEKIIDTSFVSISKFKNGKPNGLCKITSTRIDPYSVSVTEFNYVDGELEGPSSNVSNLGFMSSNSSSNYIKGKQEGLSRMIMFDKDGKLTCTVDTVYENDKAIGSKYYDENGIYDAEMSKIMSEGDEEVEALIESSGVSTKNKDGVKNDSLKDKQILLIVPSSQDSKTELQKVKEMLEQKDGKVTVSDTKLAEVKWEMKDFDALVILGCSDSSKTLWDNKKLIDLVKEAEKSDKIIAAIGLSPVVLAKAGILKDKEATVFKNDETLKIFKDNEIKYNKEEDLVIYENIITASNQDVIKRFTKEIIELLEK